MTLEELGWNDAFAREWAAYEGKGWQPARLIRDNKITYGALLGDGEELEVVMSGKVYHEAETDAELPAVGDWVAVDTGEETDEPVIRARLPRQTCLSRKMSGRSTEDVVRVGVWLDDTRDFWSFNAVYSEYFSAHPPARACVQSSMMVDCKVEIDCVAYRADRA